MSAAAVPLPNTVRVLIADDHRLFAEALEAILATDDRIEVAAHARDGHEACALYESVRPDIVLMDIAMPGLGGLETTLELKKAHPDVKIIVLTQYTDREYVRRFMRAGVSGYVLKRSAGSELLAAIRAVAAGGLVLDPAVARDAVETATSEDGAATSEDRYDSLSEREKQVLKLIAEGRSTKEVAELLGISVKTAMTHREHVMRKLDVHNRTDLIRLALRLGVIRVES